MSAQGLEGLDRTGWLTHTWISELDHRLQWNDKARSYRDPVGEMPQSVMAAVQLLSTKIIEGGLEDVRGCGPVHNIWLQPCKAPGAPQH
jgi:hypothetical protein